MNLETLDLIREYELQIKERKRDKKHQAINESPAFLFNIDALHEFTHEKDIVIESLEEKREKLIEEYGADYQKDRELYDRIAVTEDLRNEVQKLKNRVYKLEELDKALRYRVIPYKEESNNFQLESPYKVLIIGIFILSIIRILIEIFK